MARSTLARHQNRLARLRTSAEGGGGGTGGSGEGGGAGGGAGSGESGKPDPQAGEDAVDENGVKLGFPAKTPVAEMNDKQQAAYWRNESKKQQRLADARKDYDSVKDAAAKWAEHEKQQQTPSEKAITEAREAAALEAKKEISGDAALASLRVILQTRGKSEEESNDLLEFVSPDRFLTSDGKVDHQKVMTYADKLVPAGSQGGGGGYGQGRFEQTQQSRSAAGIAEAERRGFIKKS